MREVHGNPRWPRLAFGGIFITVGALMMAPFFLMQTAQAEEGSVVVNEIYPSPINTSEKEWVELYNPTAKDISLEGWTIDEANGTKVKLEGLLNSGAWRFVEVKNFNNDGDTATLRNKDGIVVDQVVYPSIVKGESYARVVDGGGDWTVTAKPTKGSWNELDTEKPTIDDLRLFSEDRWEAVNLLDDTHFKSGDRFVAGGELTASARIQDNQIVKEVIVTVEGPEVNLTFEGDAVERNGDRYEIKWDTADRNGEYVITFIARDGGRILGEVPNEERHSIKLIVDNTKPTSSITVPTEQTYFSDSLRVDASLDDGNGISKVWLGIRQQEGDEVTKLAEEAWPNKEWSTQFDTSTLKDGTYELLLKAWDTAGNQADTVIRQIRLNNRPPTTPAVVSPGSGTTVNGDGTLLDWTDSNDGNGGIYYTFAWSTSDDLTTGLVAGESATRYTESQRPIPATQSDGTYYWQVTACDLDHRCSPSAIWTVIIDTTAPVLEVDAPVRNADGTYSVTGRTNEDMPVYVYLDGEAEATVIMPIEGTWVYVTDQPLILGEHRLTVTSQDSVGNEGSVTTTFVAELPPVVTVVGDRPRLATVSESPAAVVAATSPAIPAIVKDVIEENAAVLGADATSKDAAPVEATSQGWMLLGIAWYWWMLGLGGVGVGAWVFFLRRGVAL